MPTYQFEAMDATGQEIKDVIDAPTEEEAQATIRQMGYFVTKIAVKKAVAGKVFGFLIHRTLLWSLISRTFSSSTLRVD